MYALLLLLCLHTITTTFTYNCDDLKRSPTQSIFVRTYSTNGICRSEISSSASFFCINSDTLNKTRNHRRPSQNWDLDNLRKKKPKSAYRLRHDIDSLIRWLGNYLTKEDKRLKYEKYIFRYAILTIETNENDRKNYLKNLISYLIENGGRKLVQENNCSEWKYTNIKFFNSQIKFDVFLNIIDDLSYEKHLERKEIFSKTFSSKKKLKNNSKTLNLLLIISKEGIDKVKENSFMNDNEISLLTSIQSYFERKLNDKISINLYSTLFHRRIPKSLISSSISPSTTHSTSSSSRTTTITTKISSSPFHVISSSSTIPLKMEVIPFSKTVEILNTNQSKGKTEETNYLMEDIPVRNSCLSLLKPNDNRIGIISLKADYGTIDKSSTFSIRQLLQSTTNCQEEELLEKTKFYFYVSPNRDWNVKQYDELLPLYCYPIPYNDSIPIDKQISIDTLFRVAFFPMNGAVLFEELKYVYIHVLVQQEQNVHSLGYLEVRLELQKKVKKIIEKSKNYLAVKANYDVTNYRSLRSTLENDYKIVHHNSRLRQATIQRFAGQLQQQFDDILRNTVAKIFNTEIFKNNTLSSKNIYIRLEELENELKPIISNDYVIDQDKKPTEYQIHLQLKNGSNLETIIVGMDCKTWEKILKTINQSIKMQASLKTSKQCILPPITRNRVTNNQNTKLADDDLLNEIDEATRMFRILLTTVIPGILITLMICIALIIAICFYRNSLRNRQPAGIVSTKSFEEQPLNYEHQFIRDKIWKESLEKENIACATSLECETVNLLEQKHRQQPEALPQTFRNSDHSTYSSAQLTNLTPATQEFSSKHSTDTDSDGYIHLQNVASWKSSNDEKSPEVTYVLMNDVGVTPPTTFENHKKVKERHRQSLNTSSANNRDTYILNGRKQPKIFQNELK
ncbi:hypothetical protein SNEBB_001154 [Seison nebaliae]|nr:hypothetical protein SNEBB_001154 [Seison nebaliae]